jgi:hypothetical protein
MKKYLDSIMKSIIKAIIVMAMISALSIAISYFFKLVLSNTIMYAGIICLVLGILSIIGNNNVTSDPTFFQSKSLFAKTVNDINSDNFKSRESSMNFLLFMFVVGALLIVISMILEYFHV